MRGSTSLKLYHQLLRLEWLCLVKPPPNQAFHELHPLQQEVELLVQA